MMVQRTVVLTELAAGVIKKSVQQTLAFSMEEVDYEHFSLVESLQMTTTCEDEHVSEARERNLKLIESRK